MNSKHADFAVEILDFVVEHGFLGGLEAYERREHVQRFCRLIVKLYFLGKDDGRAQVMDEFRAMAPAFRQQNLQLGVQHALSQIANPQ